MLVNYNLNVDEWVKQGGSWTRVDLPVVENRFVPIEYGSDWVTHAVDITRGYTLTLQAKFLNGCPAIQWLLRNPASDLDHPTLGLNKGLMLGCQYRPINPLFEPPFDRIFMLENVTSRTKFRFDFGWIPPEGAPARPRELEEEVRRLLAVDDGR